MHKLIILACVLFVTAASAQNPAQLIWGTDADATFSPSYKGGLGAMSLFIKQNLKSPKGYGSVDDVVVTCKVMIDSTGKVTNALVKSYTGNTEYKAAYCNEALRVLKIMPTWNPATKGGKPIAFYTMVELKFKDYIK
jgi:periplasmic protein TonB